MFLFSVCSPPLLPFPPFGDNVPTLLEPDCQEPYLPGLQSSSILKLELGWQCRNFGLFR